MFFLAVGSSFLLFDVIMETSKSVLSYVTREISEKKKQLILYIFYLLWMSGMFDVPYCNQLQLQFAIVNKSREVPISCVTM